MYCKFCGKEIDDDSLFCSYCGVKQSEKHSPKTEENVVSQENNTKTVSVNLSFGNGRNLKKLQNTDTAHSVPKYDFSYQKETEATIVGVILLILSFLLIVFKPFRFNNPDSYNQFRIFYSIAVLVTRIFIIIWVVKIAKRQNRDSFTWGVFTFFLPSIALIVIGQLKKKNSKININTSLSKEENSILLMEKAKKYLNEKNYNDCIRFLEKAVELDSNNKIALDLLRKARLEIPNDVSKSNIQTLYRETKDRKILKIISENHQTVGARVFIDNVIAPDGKYCFLNNNKKLTVKNGVITEIDNDNILTSKKEWVKYNCKQGDLEIEIYKLNKLPWDGDKAKLNNRNAPDGKYKIAFMQYVHINNGTVSKISII